MGDVEITVQVTNKKGIHARAAAKFVKTAELFDAAIKVAKISGVGVVTGIDPAEASGHSILGLMMLGAECSSTIRLCASGTQAHEAVDSIKKLVEDKFGEE